MEDVLAARALHRRSAGGQDPFVELVHGGAAFAADVHGESPVPSGRLAGRAPGSPARGGPGVEGVDPPAADAVLELVPRNSVSHIETRSTAGPRYLVNALAQGLALLERFDGRRGLTLMELARGLGWTKTTTFRYLATLVALGYLDLDGESRRYRPTVKVLRLGAAYLASLSLPELALPHLEKLSERFGESVNLAVLDEAEVVYVARAGSKRILSTNLGVGSRLPAHCTSMGKVLLAWLDETRQRQVMGEMTFTRFTPKTVTSPARLREALRVVRRRGYAINDQEMDLGLRSCAAPVFDRSGAAVAALNISVSSARATLDELEARYVPAVRATARDISGA